MPSSPADIADYNLLLLSAFGLQRAVTQSPVDVMERYVVCHEAASQVVTIVMNRVSDLRYSPDAHLCATSLCDVPDAAASSHPTPRRSCSS